MTNFPIRVRYIDKNEVQVANTSEDIQKGRAFVVESINNQWGRKPVPADNIVREDYESS